MGANGLSYEETAGAVVTRKQAFAEIRRHGLNPADFVREVADRERYDARSVLDWLGY